jgi:hypothetical protein
MTYRTINPANERVLQEFAVLIGLGSRRRSAS